METRDALSTRRSVRQFTTRPVDEGALIQLLRAAMQAPSAGNQQPWQFVVIDDRRILDAVPSYHPYAPMCAEAPLAVLVCGDLRDEKHKGYLDQDCAAATENLLLAAHDLGLGAVWTGIHPREDRIVAFRSHFSLPREVVPFALVVIGHPAVQPAPGSRFRADRIHRNRWGSTNSVGEGC